MGYPMRTTGRDNRLACAVSPILEQLENRRLLSAALLDGVLTIDGTGAADTIFVTTAAKNEGRLKVTVNKQATLFDAAAVKSIVIRGGAGNDYIALESPGKVLATPAEIRGGAGNDTLSGAAGDDILHGDAGDDFVSGKAGNDLLVGGDGDDRLIGGDGDDRIYGQKGNDLISSNPVAADGKNDQVFPGPGKNQVNVQYKPNFPIFTYTGTPQGYSVEQMRRAYGFGELSDKSYANRGEGQVIAIVDAYHSPTARKDLATFSRQFGLPLPNKQNFIQVSANKRKLTTDEGWSGEALLDIQWAHAIAPEATIILVEAASPLNPDIVQAIDVAVGILNRRFNGGVVSLSLGAAENVGQTLLDGTFDRRNPNTKNISFVAAAGDDPQPSHPSTYPNVVSVGGTKLFLDAYGNRLGGDVIHTIDPISGDPIMYHDSEVSQPIPYPIEGGERPWWLAGSGPSSVYNAPAWQESRGIGPERGTPDIAWNADPNSGVSVYNTFGSAGGAGWATVGGTSAGAPQFAALVALANQLRANKGLGKIGRNLPELIYRMGGRGQDAYMNDVTQLGVLPLTLPTIPHPAVGPYLYPAAPGWDYASGWGSPNARSLIPALAGQKIPLTNKTIKITGRLSQLVTTTGGTATSALSSLSFKGSGTTVGYTALGTNLNVRQIFSLTPPSTGTGGGTTTTPALTLFGFDAYGIAMPGNPILWHRDGNSIVGFGKFEFARTTATDNQGGNPPPTATVQRGFVKYVGTITKGKISGQFYTADANGRKVKNMLWTDPNNPTSVPPVLFTGKFSS